MLFCNNKLRRLIALAWLAAALSVAGGCHTLTTGNHLGVARDEHLYPPPNTPTVVGHEGVLPPPPVNQPPSELAKISLPAYRVEPPDILLINAIRLAPKAPYFLQPLDILQINVLGTLPDAPISGTFQIEPDGTVNLGPAYGNVKVRSLAVGEASRAVEEHLRRVLRAPEVSVSLLQAAGQQEISGEHLVGPDGTVNLGVYGNIYITGMTIPEARAAIERHLSEHLELPSIALDVVSYNSKVYYVITEGAGFGDTVVRVPVTGNETVLDAVATIGGISRVANKKKIWIARPGPAAGGCDQVLVVDWEGITKGANTATNYQLLPGDRLFIAEDRLIAMDSAIAKMTAPFERLFGSTLLGAQTIQVLQRFPGGFSSGF